jgi:CheY-like chemotaxis protein
VVFLTAHTDKDTVARAQATKPAGYISKPFDRDRLNQTIANALGVEVIVPEEQETVKASILLVDNSNRTQTISLSLLGKQYRVRIATAWSRAKQMLKEAKIDLIVANIDQADAGRGQALRTLRREHDVQVRPSSWRRRSHRRMCSCSRARTWPPSSSSSTASKRS